MRASILIKFEILQSELNVASKKHINSKHIYIYIVMISNKIKKKLMKRFQLNI